MSRSCGIHIDQRRFHAVVLDGGSKKHRVVATITGEIPFEDDPVEAVAEELRAFVKSNKIKVDNVVLAVDSGMAAFRTLTVPFDDRSKIEDIIKFEIESDLPQWDIDDVIVDFLVLGTKPGVESSLLVTGIPKPRLERQLAACDRGGLEAQDAELDGTALFEAASATGALSEQAAQVLVHVGDSTTTVVVVDGGRLVAMRAIRAGAMPPVASTALSEELEGEPDEEGEASAEAPHEDQDSLRTRLDKTASRIRRELGRTVAGATTENPIEAIYLCGHQLPALAEEGELFDVPVQPLNAGPDEGGLGQGSEDEDLAIAYGSALRALGAGVLEPSLRREELRFTGKFERVELPIAVFALLLCTLLGVKLIVTQKRIGWRDEGNIEMDQEGDMQTWLRFSNVYLLPDPEEGYPGRLKNPSPQIANYLETAVSGRDKNRTKYQELLFIRGQLVQELDALKRDLGHISDVKQPQSALQASTLVLGVLNSLGDRVGRYAIRRFGAEFKGGSGTSRSVDKVEIMLDMDFFAETDVEASQHHTAFRNAVDGEDWCLDFPERPSTPFPDGGGLSFEGLRIQVDVAQALEERSAGATP